MAALPDSVTSELAKLLQFGVPYPVAIELAWRPRLDATGKFPFTVLPDGFVSAGDGGTSVGFTYDGGTASSTYTGSPVDGGPAASSLALSINGGTA